MPKAYRTLEVLTGRGPVRLGDRVSARVIYSLAVRQELIQADGELVDGLKETTGRVIVIDGERNLMAYSELTLRLEDGREAVFTCYDTGQVPGEFRILVRRLGHQE